jgi:hypothetical protein
MSTSSMLEKEYYRPYSQNELQYKREIVLNSLKIGSTRAHHIRCDHFYCVKDKGRKEKEIKEAKKDDIGNCSVCWRFQKTPRHLKEDARELICSFKEMCFSTSRHLYYMDVDIETKFYKWLYME